MVETKPFKRDRKSVVLVFDTTSNVPLKQRYNDAINLCVSCHQTECTGPIPRIKKLLIH